MIANRFFAVATLVCAFGGVALAQSDDPLVGTWKLNVAKSKGALFKSGTTKIEAVGAGVKFTGEMVAEDGTMSQWSFTATYDGKDNPVTGNSPYGDVTAMTRVDASTTRLTSKQGGKPTVTQTIVVSSDGKTRTTTTKEPTPRDRRWIPWRSTRSSKTPRDPSTAAWRPRRDISMQPHVHFRRGVSTPPVERSTW